MNTKVKHISLFMASIILAACASAEPPTARVISSGGPNMQQAQQEAYNGPKARIAVNKFTNKSARGGWKLGKGMADMLNTALFHSNRFIVLDRTDKDALLGEQDLGASGRIKKETAAPIGELEGAELLVTAAVTAFHPNASGVAGGLGVPAGGGFLGLGGSGKHAYMAIDIKVVDARTGRIVSAATVEGKSTDYFVGIGGIIGGAPLGIGLMGYENTPAEKAIRVCIVKAVDYIASMTPATYYRYK